MKNPKEEVLFLRVFHFEISPKKDSSRGWVSLR